MSLCTNGYGSDDKVCTYLDHGKTPMIRFSPLKSLF